MWVAKLLYLVQKTVTGDKNAALKSATGPIPGPLAIINTVIMKALKPLLSFLLLLLIACEKDYESEQDISLNKFLIPLNNDVRWNYVGTVQDFPYGEIHTLYQYYIDGDTISNGIIYKKLWRVKEEKYIYTEEQDTAYLYNIECKGGIRQDEQSYNVYYSSFSKEVLLYQFDLDLNDSIEIWITEGASFTTVARVDSIETNGIFRKVYDINSNGLIFPNCIIDGIGCTLGLVQRINYGYFERLSCYKVDGEIYYEPIPGFSKDIKELVDN